MGLLSVLVPLVAEKQCKITNYELRIKGNFLIRLNTANKKHTRILKLILFVMLYLFVTPSLTIAHRVFLTAYVEGDAVFVEAGFSDGTLCKHSAIEVFDPSGKKLLEGKTDEKGGFSFKPPQKTDLN